MNWIEIFTFDIVGDKYRITYLGDKPISVYFTTYLIGFNSPFKTIRFHFDVKGRWFIPVLNYKGCSFISVSNSETKETLFSKIIDKNLSRGRKGQNIICVGLNKSGTSSFTSAMESFGYQSFSENQQFQFVAPEVYHGDYGKLFSILNNPQFNLFNDKPFSFPKIYQEIYKQRPNDVYVLTLRKDSETWVKSVLNFYDSVHHKNLLKDSSFMTTRFTDESFRYLLNPLVTLFDSWGLKNGDDLSTKLLEVYEKHKDDCLEFFKNKPNNFQVVEIEKKGELKRFTDWLGIENSIEDFPWKNKNHKGLHS